MYYWFNLFSFWIYIFFILYYLKLISFNPKPFFEIILLRDIIKTFQYLLNQDGFITNTILLRTFIISSIHYSPLYYLTMIDKRPVTKQSVLFYGSLFALYLGYIHFNKFDIHEIYSQQINYVSIKDFIRLRFNSTYEFGIWAILLLYMNLKLIKII